MSEERRKQIEEAAVKLLLRQSEGMTIYSDDREVQMSEEKKPREFWIEETVTMGGSRFWATDYEDPGMKNVIHVREVMPDEPDWRALAEELAEALFIMDQVHTLKFHADACVCILSDLGDNHCNCGLYTGKNALQKFEQAVKNES